MPKDATIPFVHVPNVTVCRGPFVTDINVIPVAFHPILPLKETTVFSFRKGTLVELSTIVVGCVSCKEACWFSVAVTQRHATIGWLFLLLGDVVIVVEG